jgi:hypothetical protein
MFYGFGNRQVTPLDSLTGWWGFNEYTATPLDRSVNAKNLAADAAGLPAWAPFFYTNQDQIGGGWTHDGTVNKSFTTGAAASAFIGAGALTIAAWCVPTGSPISNGTVYNTAGIVGENAGYVGLYRGDVSGGDMLHAYVWNGGIKRASSNVITVGQLYHVAMTADGTTLRLYVDGQFVSSVASGNADDISGTMRVGQAYTVNSNASFTGRLGEVRIYNRALSPGEILALYQTPLVAPQDDLSILQEIAAASGGNKLINGGLISPKLVSGRLAA